MSLLGRLAIGAEFSRRLSDYFSKNLARSTCLWSRFTKWIWLLLWSLVTPALLLVRITAAYIFKRHMMPKGASFQALIVSIIVTQYDHHCMQQAFYSKEMMPIGGMNSVILVVLFIVVGIPLT